MSNEKNAHGDEDELELVSKSQIKREMHALQALGKKLVQLDKQRLASIPLPETLHDAILTAQNIHQNGAMKRQLQYIGKVMRSINHEPIEKALNKLEGKDKQNSAVFHRCENWRDRLLNEGNSALEAFIGEYPATDRQQLRQIIRNAVKEQQSNKPPKSARNLFRYLRELIE